jgi:DNA (cytosine-5)-methyltransferase 1
MRSISLFTGAGGLDLGCEAAGFQTVAAVEMDDTACETLLANRCHLPLLERDAVLRDITKVDVADLLERGGLAVGEPTLVHGGPPCTPFSKSGYWLEYKRAGSDPKASLLDSFVRVVAEARPKAFLMENVYGLAYRNHNRAILERFVTAIRSAGYSFDHRILLAADYGVPQLRQRLFCVGMRSDLLDVTTREWRFSWPTPTHSGPHETRKGWDDSLPPHVSAREALAGLTPRNNPPEPEEVVRGTFAEELHAVPPGQNYLWWTAHRGHPEPRFEWRSRYWTFLLKLDPCRPSPTIQGQPGPWVGPFHWESRRLRVGEIKRLMTFPDSFRVLGSRREQQLQLGNAVPPMLGRVIANTLRQELVRIQATDSLPLAA